MAWPDSGTKVLLMRRDFGFVRPDPAKVGTVMLLLLEVRSTAPVLVTSAVIANVPGEVAK